ncbi:uncharacterized protein RMCC_5790 [Mycolicibacterium canariasense]|uniref:Uncharacterized protein n=1 Tax=Mycolicibacterium canariasense TaxID=228230 RepID=A0A117IC36_MYCCR|nr:hypothetical protein [Mycolicibacterium canariasense]MCV7210177.1 hypothetical protein [Mycolicibacterium canariasense]ORU97879.1 hypothetical protein AWB94_29450 [Mycolicibacterium canariasense]GAS98825.1 uncharacterized protein RMCC_5790 [Mycolicibacterium canariasense]
MTKLGPRAHSQQRAANAYKLRCTGRTYDDIANTIGYGSPASAFKAVQKHIARMPAEEQDMARAMSAGTYLNVVARCFAVAEIAERQGKPHTAVMALDAAAGAQAKHDALRGLNVPVTQKVDVNVQHSAAGVVEAAREQMRQVLAAKQSALPAPQPNPMPIIDAEIVSEP